MLNFPSNLNSIVAMLLFLSFLLCLFQLTQQLTDVELQNIGGPDHVISFNVNGQIKVKPAAAENPVFDQNWDSNWNNPSENNRLSAQILERTPVQTRPQQNIKPRRPVSDRPSTPNPNSGNFSWSRSWSISPDGKLSMQIYDRKRGEKVETRQLSPKEVVAWRVTPVPYAYRRRSGTQ